MGTFVQIRARPLLSVGSAPCPVPLWVDHGVDRGLDPDWILTPLYPAVGYTASKHNLLAMALMERLLRAICV